MALYFLLFMIIFQLLLDFSTVYVCIQCDFIKKKKKTDKQ